MSVLIFNDGIVLRMQRALNVVFLICLAKRGTCSGMQLGRGMEKADYGISWGSCQCPANLICALILFIIIKGSFFLFTS